MIKMVCFDLDGTLCASIPICIEAFTKAVGPYSDKVLSTKEVVSTFGLNEIGMIKKVVQENEEKALEDFYMYYEAFHNSCTSPFPGINKTISFLKKRTKIVLITGKGKKSCKISLEKIGLTDVFDEIFYGSEIYPNNKDDAMTYLLEKYSLDKGELVYVGDSVTDIEACQRAGVTCLSAAWGGQDNITKLREINPLFTFESVDDLMGYFYTNIS